MTTMQDIDQRVAQLVAWYGDGHDGASPTGEQWRRVLERDGDKPLTLVNFFKLRERAAYPDAGVPADPGSGQDAFNRYAAVSMPAMQQAGGRFLLVAPMESTFMGADEDWDVVAVGSYPDSAAVLALFENPDYRDCFVHRTAACARQKVLLCSG